eukprot:3902833-Rhodomonas_salina.1
MSEFDSVLVEERGGFLAEATLRSIRRALHEEHHCIGGRRGDGMDREREGTRERGSQQQQHTSTAQDPHTGRCGTPLTNTWGLLD